MNFIITKRMQYNFQKEIIMNNNFQTNFTILMNIAQINIPNTHKTPFEIYYSKLANLMSNCVLSYANKHKEKNNKITLNDCLYGIKELIKLQKII